MNKPFYGVATMPNSQRAPLLNHSEAPGPGTYDFNKERKPYELPKWTLSQKIQHGSCFENNSIAPGPGEYEIKSSIKQQPQNKFLYKEEKYKPFIEKTYSQNNLNLPGCLNPKGGFSFGYREPFQQIEKSPGPIYHLDKSTQLKRKTKMQNSHRGFGYGQRNNIYSKQNTPGPGAFDHETKQNKNNRGGGWSFGSGKRDNSLDKQSLGPGEYDPQQYNLTRSFKLRGRRQDKIVIENNSGPGAYDIPDTKTKIGTRFRPIREDNVSYSDDENNQQDISPFSYNPPRCFDKPSGRGCSLAAKLNHQNIDNGKPGPGTYQVHHHDFIKKNGSYMGRKLPQKKRENTMDNFYKYNPQMNSVAKGSPKFSFPQGRRGVQQNDKLGRGQDFHQSLDNKSTGYSYSIGNGKRFNELKKQGGYFKGSSNMYSTIGCLPSYLKKKQRD